MNTIHDENKIDELIDIIGTKTAGNLNYYQPIKDALKEYAQHIRNKNTIELSNAWLEDKAKWRNRHIDECIDCVPEPIDGTPSMRDERDAYNSCREQTITNLNNLKNSK